MHSVTVHLSSDQVQAIAVAAGLILALIVMGASFIASLGGQLARQRRQNADLHQRLLTAEVVNRTQTLALCTVDELARATRRGKK
jgi:hypothetical protein